MDRIAQLEQEIQDIKKRNARVERDKAWEISLTRKIIIAISTYILIGLYMMILGIAKPWLNAIVPTLGFILSTLTVGWAKEIWINRKK